MELLSYISLDDADWTFDGDNRDDLLGWVLRQLTKWRRHYGPDRGARQDVAGGGCTAEYGVAYGFVSDGETWLETRRVSLWAVRYRETDSASPSLGMMMWTGMV